LGAVAGGDNVEPGLLEVELDQFNRLRLVIDH
jgi:hypothetical protein